MALTLVGSGGLFLRLGDVGTLMNDALALAGSREAPNADVAGTAVTRFQNLSLQFQSNEQADFSVLYDQFSAWQNTSATFIRQLSLFAQTFLIDQCNRELSPPLTALQFTQAMGRVIGSMQQSGDTIKQPTLTVGAVTQGVPPVAQQGNSVVLASVYDVTGRRLDALYSETVQLTSTADYQTGPAGTYNAEPWVALGQIPSTTGQQGPNWPQGSGASVGVVACNPSTNPAASALFTAVPGGNALSNSDFEGGFTGGVPNNWFSTAGQGQIGDGNAASAYFGDHCLQIVGDGVSLTDLRQSLGSGTTPGPATLVPHQVFATNWWLKVSSVPAAGQLRIALVTSANAVVNDDSGAPNQVVVDLTKLTTSYQALGNLFMANSNAILSGTPFFRMPASLPAGGVYFDLKLIVALSAGSKLFVDFGGLAANPPQLYTGGPFLQVFPGNVPPLTGAAWQVPFTNAWDSKMGLALQRLFGLRGLNLQVPSASAGFSVPESYIS